MEIHRFVWPDDRVNHIAEHGVTPAEVEEVCFGPHALVLRSRSQGRNPVYHVLGQTVSGRFLLSVVIRFSDGTGYPVTARPMTHKEENRYRKWRLR
jgi:uncharacterized protein